MYARESGFSGPQILDFFSQYSNDIESYPWRGGAPSRYLIFEDCLSNFELDQQRSILSDLIEFDGPMSHGQPNNEDVSSIRDWLNEATNPLDCMPIETDTLNWMSVKREWTRASERVNHEPDSAITSARTLLESIYKHILDELEISYEDQWDLPRFHRTTTQALQVSPNQQTERCVSTSDEWLYEHHQWHFRYEKSTERCTWIRPSRSSS